MKTLIREVREQRGLTQTKLGELVGKSMPTISKYENDQMEIRAVLLVRIAEVLGVPVTRLLPSTAERPELIDQE
jgi:transcriptional regulator with XRE-family HTH domain